MADQNKREDQKGGQGSTSSTKGMDQAGDPGRTPGKAEGDEQTVEEDLRAKEGKGQK